MDTDTITCPLCKHENPADAKFCNFCGASLDGGEVDSTTERMKNPKLLPAQKEELPTSGLPGTDVPDGAIVFFVPGDTKPILISVKDEIILGRHVTGAPEDVIDLTPFGGLDKGVSRKHAVIRKNVNGFEIIDLFSTNGSWLNLERLLPDMVYTLRTGMQLRLGQLVIYIQIGSSNAPQETQQK
jgi:hypothetical protein